MSEHARALVKANQLEGVVEVIEGSMEDVTLPEKGWFHQFKTAPMLRCEAVFVHPFSLS